MGAKMNMALSKTVAYPEPKLFVDAPWLKYGMALMPYYSSQESLDDVIRSHTLVAKYLDTHSTARGSWMRGNKNYFDILELAEQHIRSKKMPANKVTASDAVVRNRVSELPQGTICRWNGEYYIVPCLSVSSKAVNLSRGSFIHDDTEVEVLPSGAVVTITIE
jgi:hypothetical protein